jgi:hypothetical protein
MKNLKRKSVSQKIADSTHTSLSRATQEIFPFIREIFRNNMEMSGKIADSLGLDDEEIGWLSEK